MNSFHIPLTLRSACDSESWRRCRADSQLTWACDEQRVLNNARTLWTRFKDRTRSDVVRPCCSPWRHHMALPMLNGVVSFLGQQKTALGRCI